MRYKILIVADRQLSLAIEVEMLKEKSFLVYTCNSKNTEAMIGEVRPDVVYFHPNTNTDIYHKLLLNTHLSHIPVIYTLLEDDVYLINRERITRKGHRPIICDNVLDAIKTALIGMEKVYAAPLQRTASTLHIHR